MLFYCFRQREGTKGQRFNDKFWNCVILFIILYCKSKLKPEKFDKRCKICRQYFKTCSCFLSNFFCLYFGHNLRTNIKFVFFCWCLSVANCFHKRTLTKGQQFYDKFCHFCCISVNVKTNSDRTTSTKGQTKFKICLLSVVFLVLLIFCYMCSHRPQFPGYDLWNPPGLKYWHKTWYYYWTNIINFWIEYYNSCLKKSLYLLG